ncbi:MAG: ATP-binding protein [Balneola sp.]
MSTQLEIFEHFKLRKPKDDTEIQIKETETFLRTKQTLESLIEDNKWRAFSGRIGSGKTTTIIGAIRDIHDENKNFDVVEILSPDREKIGAGQILASFVRQVGEKYIGQNFPSGKIDTRLAQVQRILMTAHEKKKKIVLVIDEAQELNTKVLNTIKRLRDTTFIKRAIHLPVILIGQPSLDPMIRNNDEVKHRIRSTQFSYTRKELIGITEFLAKGLLSREVCRQIVDVKTTEDAYRNKQYPTPLELNSDIEIAMENAFKLGHEALELKHFEIRELQRPAPKKERKKIEISADIADAKIKNIDSAKEAS